MLRWSTVSRLWTVWVLTRALIVVFIGVTALPHSIWDGCAADLGLYREWAGVFVHQHTFPLADERWQYPPGAAVVMVAPWLLGAGHAYTWWFFAMVGAADAGVLGLLIRSVRREGRVASWAGPWVWVLGVALVGRVLYGRFDLIVAASAVAALLWALRRPLAAGVAVAAGVLLKLWPIVVLLGWKRPVLWRMGVSAAVSGAVMGAALTTIGPGAWSFARFQSERGLQIEAPATTPLMIARLIRHSWRITHRYGAEELLGPGVSAVSHCCVPLTVIGGLILLVVWWRKRPPAPDLALAAVLIALTTSRVLSPQYLIWAVAVAAVCALYRSTTQRPIVLLVLVSALLSQVEFPFVYDKVASGHVVGVIVLLLRNGVLVYATVWSIVRLWRPVDDETRWWNRALRTEAPAPVAAVA
ncbi:MAG: DUF2029 domain-containing protein [Nocardia sp.]|nr:DUF2029 domain-containing protein [Nocardia sp.]